MIIVFIRLQVLVDVREVLGRFRTFLLGMPFPPSSFAYFFQMTNGGGQAEADRCQKLNEMGLPVRSFYSEH